MNITLLNIIRITRTEAMVLIICISLHRDAYPEAYC